MKYLTRLVYIFLFFAACLSITGCRSHDQLEIINTVKIDESQFAFRQLPDFLPINDSTALTYFRDGKCLLINYWTGKLQKTDDFNEYPSLINTVAASQKTDTSSPGFKNGLLQQNANGIKNVFICAASRYDTASIFISMIVLLPQITYADDSTISKQAAVPIPIGVICDDKTMKPLKITPFDFEWKEDETNFEYPTFGQNIFKGNLYIAHIATKHYAGEILSSFDIRTLKRTKKNPSIHHMPFVNNTGVPMPTFFHFINEENSCLVDNRTKIYDLNTGKVLLDASQYLKNLNYISFFIPLDKHHEKWFINYADTTFKNLKTVSHFTMQL